MPTPTSYATQSSAIKPMNGVVPGLTWDSFLSGFSPTSTNPAGNQSSIAGIGTVYGGGFTGTGTPGADWQSVFGDPNNPGMDISPDWYDPTTGHVVIDGQDLGDYSDYVQPVGDGTENVFTPNADGTVQSHNQTINNDSWWDSTGLPLVASLVTGGAAGLANAAGIGVDAAGNAIGGGTASLGNTATNVATNDIGSAAYNPFNPANWTADAGTVASDASPAFGGTLDPVTVTGAATGGALGAADAALATGATGIGAGIGAAASGDGSSGAIDGGTLDPVTVTGTNFQPTPVDTSQFGLSAANTILQDGGFGNASSSSSASNPFKALSNLYNGTADGSDYWSLAQAGLGLGSALLGSHAATSAANTQSNAANAANQLASQIFGQTTANNAPYINAATGGAGAAGGSGSLGTQASLLGLNGKAAQQTAYNNFTTTPNYQFAYDQGMKAANNGAAASGLLGSGRYLKDLTSFGQGLASQQYNNYFNQLGGISSLGQAAAAGQAAQGNAFANTYGNNLTSGAAASAAGTIGSANAIANGISSIAGTTTNNALLNYILNNGKSNGIYGN